MKYIKRPTTIDAEQFMGEHIVGVCDCVHPLSGHSGPCTSACEANRYWHVHTINGPALIRVGSWVCHQLVSGSRYYWPVDEATFAATYDPDPATYNSRS